MEWLINARFITTRKSEARKSLDRTRRRWNYNIKIDLKILAYEDVNWNELAKDWIQLHAFVEAVKIFCMYRTEKYFSSWTTVSFSRKTLSSGVEWFQ